MNTELILDYEEVLLGNQKTVSSAIFYSDAVGNEKLALNIMKYAFETYLRWTPIELYDWLTPEIMERLKPTQLLSYVRFPSELEPTDLFYVVWKIYPQQTHYSKEDLILRVYKKMLADQIKKYPKEFFTATEGVDRAIICLRYLIENYIPLRNTLQLYALFSARGNTLLKKYKLLVPCKDLFGTPLVYLHESLPKNQCNNTFYLYCRFLQEFDPKGFSEVLNEQNKLERRLG